MASLVELNRLRTRIHIWIDEEAALGNLAAKAGTIIAAILYEGNCRAESSRQ